MSELIYKQAPVNLEPSENDGYLIGYANIYNVKDLQGDISPGSFIKTVTERKAKIKSIETMTQPIVEFLLSLKRMTR